MNHCSLSSLDGVEFKLKDGVDRRHAKAGALQSAQKILSPQCAAQVLRLSSPGKSQAVPSDARQDRPKEFRW
jgi:hypothetical protein